LYLFHFNYLIEKSKDVIQHTCPVNFKWNLPLPDASPPICENVSLSRILRPTVYNFQQKYEAKYSEDSKKSGEQTNCSPILLHYGDYLKNTYTPIGGVIAYIPSFPKSLEIKCSSLLDTSQRLKKNLSDDSKYSIFLKTNNNLL